MTLPFGQASFPEIYERELVNPLFRPFAEQLIESLAPKPGEHVLDLACGTGIVARLAKARVGPAGRVVGVDVNPGMLAVARSVDSGIEWRQEDATALQTGDGDKFDVVSAHQGLQFFPDRLAAVRLMRRALKPGGRAGVATWRPESDLPFVRDLRLVAEKEVGPIVDRRHGFGEPGPIEALFRDAGFEGVQSRIVARMVRFADGAVFIRLNAMALVGMSAAAKDLNEEARQSAAASIARNSAPLLKAHSDPRGLAFELTTVITTGRAGAERGPA